MPGGKPTLRSVEAPVKIYIAPQQLAEDQRGFARSRHRAREHNCFGKRMLRYFPSLALVHQVSDWGSGAAANFDWMREAKRERTGCGL